MNKVERARKERRAANCDSICKNPKQSRILAFSVVSVKTLMYACLSICENFRAIVCINIEIHEIFASDT